MKYYQVILASIVGLTLINSCIGDTIDLDKIPDPDRKLSFVAPIAKIHFTMGDLISEFDDDTLLSIADDGLISRSFRKEVMLNWEGLVNIDDIHYALNYLPTPKTQLKAASSNVFTEKFKLNPTDDSRYDSLKLSNGLLTIDIVVPNQATGIINLTIPEIKLSNGQMLGYTFNVTNTVKTFHQTLNLNDAKIKFSQATDSSYVTLFSNFSLNYDPLGGIPGPIQMNFNITDMKSGLTFGYFGQTVVENKGLDIAFDFYDEYESIEKIEFADVKVELMTENYIGTPFSIEIDSMWFSHDTIDNPQKLIFSNIFDLSPAKYANPIIPTIQKFEINKTNSNILEIVNDHPNYVICNVKGTSNPHNTGAQNFLNHENNLHTTLTINFPFWFRTQMYDRADTIDFDFNDVVGDSSTTDPIDLFSLYLDFYNSLPFEIGAQLYVTDENYNIIENLLPDGDFIIESGIPNDDDKVTEPTHSEVKIEIDQEEILKFRDQKAKYIIIQTQGISYNNGNTFVKVFTDNKMDINVSVDVKGKIITE